LDAGSGAAAAAPGVETAVAVEAVAEPAGAELEEAGAVVVETVVAAAGIAEAVVAGDGAADVAAGVVGGGVVAAVVVTAGVFDGADVDVVVPVTPGVFVVEETVCNWAMSA
jgi:hypothetical protein